MDPGKVCVVSTGSQGEPMSALSLMAAGDSKWLHLRPDDVVVISAHPIPGNEWAVGTGHRRLVPSRGRGRSTPASSPST